MTSTTTTPAPAPTSPTSTGTDPMDFDTAVAHLCSPSWAPSGTHVATTQSDAVLAALLPSTRRHEGRVALGASPGAIQSLVAVLRDPLIFHEPLGRAAIRILRNLCVRLPGNQARAAECGAHTLIVDALSAALQADTRYTSNSHEDAQGDNKETTNPSSDTLYKMCTPFYGFAVEFLVNFVTGNDANSHLVWTAAFPTVLDGLLRTRNTAAAAAAGALLHNCVVAAPQLLSELVSPWPRSTPTSTRDETSLLATIISVMQAHTDAQPPASNTATGDKTPTNDSTYTKRDERFEWCFNILRRLVRASMARHCFEVLGPTLDDIVATASITISPSQHTFLNILDAGAGKSAECADDLPLESFVTPKFSLAFFAELLDVALTKRDATLLRLSASIAGSIIIINDNSGPLDELRQSAIRVAIFVLRLLAPPQCANGREGENDTSLRDAEAKRPGLDAPPAECVGLRGTMVRLIAVSCDEAPTAQDAVRLKGGIPLVLNALAYERDTTANPFLREWAVLAVRNLTLGNEENMREIGSYELQGLTQDKELLDKAGLEAFMDEKTGRPRVRQKLSTPV